MAMHTAANRHMRQASPVIISEMPRVRVVTPELSERLLYKDELDTGSGTAAVVTTSSHYHNETEMGRGGYEKALQTLDGKIVKRCMHDFFKDRASCHAVWEVAMTRSLSHVNARKFDSVSLKVGEKGMVYSEKVYKPQMPLVDQGDEFRNWRWVRQCTAYQMLQFLDFLHSMGMCHGDVKPTNVFLIKTATPQMDNTTRGMDLDNDVPWRVEFADFGHCTLRELYEDRCTIPFLPPERVFGISGTSTAMDIWGLGMTFVTMFTDAQGIVADTKEEHQSALADAFDIGEKFDYEKQAVVLYERSTPGKRKVDKVLDSLGLDAEEKNFIQECLTVSAEMRPSAKQLLKHPYVAGVETSLHHKELYANSGFDIACFPGTSSVSDKIWEGANKTILTTVGDRRTSQAFTALRLMAADLVYRTYSHIERWSPENTDDELQDISLGALYFAYVLWVKSLPGWWEKYPNYREYATHGCRIILTALDAALINPDIITRLNSVKEVPKTVKEMAAVYSCCC